MSVRQRPPWHFEAGERRAPAAASSSARATWPASALAGPDCGIARRGLPAAVRARHAEVRAAPPARHPHRAARGRAAARRRDAPQPGTGPQPLRRRSDSTLLACSTARATAMGGRELRRWLQPSAARSSRARCACRPSRRCSTAGAHAGPARPAAAHRRPGAHPVARRAALGTAARPGAAARGTGLPAGPADAAGARSIRRCCRRLAAAARRASGDHALLAQALVAGSRRHCCATAA